VTKFLILLSFVLATSVSEAHQIPNFQQVNHNLFRGGRPSVQDLRDLKLMGVKTILNLENDDNAVAKEGDVARALEFNYVSVPTATFFKPKDANVNRILAVMNDPKNFPVFIHCTHGRDRTGLMMGLYRVETDAWSPKAAYAEMVDLGFRQYLFALKGYFDKRTRRN
jgi:tyrosine-protein phosphatase SIW14